MGKVGDAFVEIHGDLRPLRKDVGKVVTELKVVDKQKAEPTIRPKVDESGLERLDRAIRETTDRIDDLQKQKKVKPPDVDLQEHRRNVNAAVAASEKRLGTLTELKKKLLEQEVVVTADTSDADKGLAKTAAEAKALDGEEVEIKVKTDTSQLRLIKKAILESLELIPEHLHGGERGLLTSLRINTAASRKDVGGRAVYDPEEDLISLRKDLWKDPGRQGQSLLHEVGHRASIQRPDWYDDFMQLVVPSLKDRTAANVRGDVDVAKALEPKIAGELEEVSQGIFGKRGAADLQKRYHPLAQPNEAFAESFMRAVTGQALPAALDKFWKDRVSEAKKKAPSIIPPEDRQEDWSDLRTRLRKELGESLYEALRMWTGNPSNLRVHLGEERTPFRDLAKSGRDMRDAAEKLEKAVEAAPLNEQRLFRGTKGPLQGLQSWTTDREIAERFAKGSPGSTTPPGRVEVAEPGTIRAIENLWNKSEKEWIALTDSVKEQTKATKKVTEEAKKPAKKAIKDEKISAVILPKLGQEGLDAKKKVKDRLERNFRKINATIWPYLSKEALAAKKAVKERLERNFSRVNATIWPYLSKEALAAKTTVKERLEKDFGSVRAAVRTDTDRVIPQKVEVEGFRESVERQLRKIDWRSLVPESSLTHLFGPEFQKSVQGELDTINWSKLPPITKQIKVALEKGSLEKVNKEAGEKVRKEVDLDVDRPALDALRRDVAALDIPKLDFSEMGFSKSSLSRMFGAGFRESVQTELDNINWSKVGQKLSSTVQAQLQAPVTPNMSKIRAASRASITTLEDIEESLKEQLDDAIALKTHLVELREVHKIPVDAEQVKAANKDVRRLKRELKDIRDQKVELKADFEDKDDRNFFMRQLAKSASARGIAGAFGAGGGSGDKGLFSFLGGSGASGRFVAALGQHSLPVLTGAALVAEGALASLAAAAVALGGALQPLVGLLAVIPAGLAALGGIAASLFATFSGVGDAVKAMQEASVKSSLDEAQVLETQRAATEAVADAKRGLADSQRQATEAQEGLTEARRDAVRNLEDMKNKAIDAALAQETANRGIKEAQAELRKVTSEGGTVLEIEAAEQGIRIARQRAREARQESQRAAADNRKAQRGGVEKEPGVVEARKRVADANRQVAESTRNLARAQERAAFRTDKLTSSQQKLRDQLAKMSPAGRQFARFLFSLKPAFESIRDASQAAALPRFQEGIEGAMKNLPVFRKSITDTSRIMGTAGERFGKFLGTKGFGKDFGIITKANNNAFRNLGRAMIPLAKAFNDVGVAAAPFVRWIGKSVLHLARLVQHSAKAGRESGGLQKFLKGTQRTLETLAKILSNVVHGFGGLFKAGAKDGQDFLETIEGWSKSFRDFTDSAGDQNKIKKFLEEQRGPLHDIKDALIAIGRLITNFAVAPGASVGLSVFATSIEALADSFNYLLLTVEKIPVIGGFASGFIANFTALFLIAGRADRIGPGIKWINNFQKGLRGLDEASSVGANALGKRLRNLGRDTAGVSIGEKISGQIAAGLGRGAIFYRKAMDKIRDLLRRGLASVGIRMGERVAEEGAGALAASTRWKRAGSFAGKAFSRAFVIGAVIGLGLLGVELGKVLGTKFRAEIRATAEAIINEFVKWLNRGIDLINQGSPFPDIGGIGEVDFTEVKKALSEKEKLAKAMEAPIGAGGHLTQRQAKRRLAGKDFTIDGKKFEADMNAEGETVGKKGKKAADKALSKAFREGKAEAITYDLSKGINIAATEKTFNRLQRVVRREAEETKRLVARRVGAIFELKDIQLLKGDDPLHLRRGILKSAEDGRQAMRGLVNQLGRVLERLSVLFRQEGVEAGEQLAKGIAEGAHPAVEQARRIREGVNNEFRLMQRGSSDAARDMVSNLRATFDRLPEVVTRSTVAMLRIVLEAMRALGTSTGGRKELKADISEITSSAQANAKGGFIQKKAVGGMVQGSGLQDTVYLPQRPGNFVVNRHQAPYIAEALASMNERLTGYAQGGMVDTVVAPGEVILDSSRDVPRVDRAMRKRFGFGLGTLAATIDTPHYAYAKGGMVPIPGQSASIHESILPDVVKLIKRYGLKVTDGYAPSGHKAAGDHPKGLAIDVVPGAGGSWDSVARLAHRAEPSQNNPVAPFRWVGWIGDPGHGPPEVAGANAHLHLSWLAGKHVGKGFAAVAKKKISAKVKGPKGAITDLATGAIKKVQRAANRRIRGAEASKFETTGNAGGRGRTSYEGPLDRTFPAHSLANAKGHARLTSRQVGEAARAYGLPGVFKKISARESSNYPGIISFDKGYGLWQITPRVQGPQVLKLIGRLGGYRQLLNPIKNARVARYLYDHGGLSHWDASGPYASGGFVGGGYSRHIAPRLPSGANAVRSAARGGFIQMFQGGGSPKKKKDDEDEQRSAKFSKLKTPKPNLGNTIKTHVKNLSAGMIRGMNRAGKKGKQKKRKIPAIDAFTSLETLIHDTIPEVEDRIQNLIADQGVVSEDFYPDERVVPRLRREGHDITRVGSSFVDWSAVETAKTELGAILGQSFGLIGMPWGRPEGLMEALARRLPPALTMLTNLHTEMKFRIENMKRRIAAMLKDALALRKDIGEWNAKIKKEEGKDSKKQDKKKLARWRTELKSKEAENNALRRELRDLTGESVPKGDFDAWEKGALGDLVVRRDQAKEHVDHLQEDKESFLGKSGIGGTFASTRVDISKSVIDLAALTRERILEAVGPTTSQLAEEKAGFVQAIHELIKTFASNIRPHGERIRSFARGGSTPRPIVMVGEEGPELAELPVGTRIHSNPASARMAKRLGIPGFATGGVVLDPQTQQPQATDAELLRAIKRLETALKEQRPVNNVEQNMTFTTPPEEQHGVQKAAFFELQGLVNS